MGIQGVGHEKGLTMFVGDMGQKQEKTQQVKNGTIFAGGLMNPQGDSANIMANKELARKQAKKLVSDVFHRDMKLDDSMEESVQAQEALLKKAGDAGRQIEQLESNLEDLKESYGVIVDENGKEIVTNGNAEEYEANVNGINEEAMIWGGIRSGAIEGKREIGKALEETKIERLKSHAMVDGSKQAEEIMKNASKEAAASLINQAKDTMDQKAEEAEKKQETIQEKKEEEEKLRDDSQSSDEPLKETQKEMQNAVKETMGDQEELDRKLRKIMEANQVLMEDLKGLDVDTEI